MAVGGAHVSWLSHTSTNTTSLSKATDYFSHMLLQRREAKLRWKKNFASTRDQTRNHQVMSPTCSPLSHLAGAPFFQKLTLTDDLELGTNKKVLSQDIFMRGMKAPLLPIKTYGQCLSFLQTHERTICPRSINVGA